MTNPFKTSPYTTQLSQEERINISPHGLKSNRIQISRDEFFSNPFLRGWLSFYDSFKVKYPEASLHEVGEAYRVKSGIPAEDGTHKFI